MTNLKAADKPVSDLRSLCVLGRLDSVLCQRVIGFSQLARLLTVFFHYADTRQIFPISSRSHQRSSTVCLEFGRQTARAACSSHPVRQRSCWGVEDESLWTRSPNNASSPQPPRRGHADRKTSVPSRGRPGRWPKSGRQHRAGADRRS
jgi:hypothetical protein